MKLFVLSAVLFVYSINCCQESNNHSYHKDIISFLASDSLKGRATGSIEERIAATYIVDHFKSLNNCNVDIQKFKFTEDSILYHSQNVLAFINNHSKKTIIIAAHFDHLGMGCKHSHSIGVKEVHNGADDNASGVALMISIAKEISRNNYSYNYLFIAHSGHEIGLYGSRYSSEHLKRKYKSIEMFINFDMVGRLNSERKLYYEYSENFNTKVLPNSNEAIILSKSVNPRISVLDTRWYDKKSIPCITFSTGLHSDYHKVTDDVIYINYGGLAEIEKLLVLWLKNI